MSLSDTMPGGKGKEKSVRLGSHALQPLTHARSEPQKWAIPGQFMPHLAVAETLGGPRGVWYLNSIGRLLARFVPHTLPIYLVG